MAEHTADFEGTAWGSQRPHGPTLGFDGRLAAGKAAQISRRDLIVALVSVSGTVRPGSPSSGCGGGDLSGLCLAVRRMRKDRNALLEGDGRDDRDIPGYLSLADHYDALIAILSATPARNLDEILAKAEAADARDAAMGREGAVGLALSIVADLTVFGQARHRMQAAAGVDVH